MTRGNGRTLHKKRGEPGREMSPTPERRGLCEAVGGRSSDDGHRKQKRPRRRTISPSASVLNICRMAAFYISHSNVDGAVSFTCKSCRHATGGVNRIHIRQC